MYLYCYQYLAFSALTLLVGWQEGHPACTWYRLTRVVPEKGPLNGCVCVCVFVLLSWPFDYFWLVVVSSGRWHEICCLGQVNIRTHTSARVVNRASRFHRSAGLEDIGFHSSSGRESPCNASASPSSSPGWVLLYSFAIYLHDMSAVHYASGRLACEIAYSSCQAIVSHKWHFVFLNAFICFIINDSKTTAILAIVIVCSHSMENWM